MRPPFSAASLPQGQRGRALALGVTGLALVLLWLGVAQPLLDTYAAQAQALLQREALAGRMADLAASLPRLRAAVTALRSQPASVAAVIEGATDAIAAAALQGTLEAMAGRAGAKLTSAEALPAEPAGSYRRLALRVTVDATWPVLIRLLQSVEQATPRMFIDDLQLHATPTGQSVRELPLDISFTLLAFRAADPASPAASRAP